MSPLRLIVVVALSAVLGAQEPNPKAPSLAHPLLSSGPLVGPATETSVRLWVQTTRPARVKYRYWKDGDEASAQTSDAVLARAENACVAVVPLTGLPFGTAYRYELLLDGVAVPRPYPTRFRTQPHWQWRTPPPDLTMALGSCAYLNHAAFDRPGTPYGGDPAIFRSMADDARSFGVIRVTGPEAARVLTLECRLGNGDLRWKHEIAADAMKTPK